ncbi:MAG: glycosyltransferase family 2 protein [Deinococcales bacterium]
MRFYALVNISMAYLVNQGLKLSDRPFFAHMNADVFVEKDSFRHLLELLLADEKLAMVGPAVRNSQGAYQNQGLAYRRYWRRLSREYSLAVPWLSGCLQLVRRSAVLKVGGMDERFRFYNEDMEWCFRLRQAGYELKLVNSEVLHLGGQSTPKRSAFIVEGYRGGYLISKRYHSRLYQALHRSVVALEANFYRHFAQNELKKMPMSRLRICLNDKFLLKVLLTWSYKKIIPFF